MNEKRISQLLLLIMLVLLLASCGAPTDTPTPIPPTTTYTPVPPTATSTQTPTPLPTNTATPTSSPTATGTASGSDPYLDEVNFNLQDYQNAFANASDYVQTPTIDFTVLLNENWKQDANMALGQLDEAAKQLENIDDAPPEYEQLDMYLKSIASETHALIANYGNGVDQLDPGAISNAVDNLNNIASNVSNASEELNKYFP